jgi:hypothetical protein
MFLKNQSDSVKIISLKIMDQKYLKIKDLKNTI